MSLGNGRNLFLNELHDGEARAYTSALWMATAVGDHDLVKRDQQRLLDLALDFSARDDQVHAALALAVEEDMLTQQQAAEVMATLEMQLTRYGPKTATGDYVMRGLVLYAALLGGDRIDEFLDQMWQKKREHGAPIRAAVAWHRGDRALAEKELEDGLEFYETVKFLWYHNVWYVALLRHVDRQLHDTTDRTDALVANIAEAAAQRTTNYGPQTAAYDHLVDTYGTISSETQPEYPYLMRGARLAELGQLDEAEADFDKAVELAPEDPDMLIARALFHAKRGAVEDSVTDFDRTLRIADGYDDPQRTNVARRVGLEVAPHAEVFDRLVSLRPQEAWLWFYRMHLSTLTDDLEAAHAAALRLEPMGFGPDRAAVALLRQDRREWERIRDSRPANGHPRYMARLLALAPTPDPITKELLEAASKASKESPDDKTLRVVLAIAHYRSGQLEEARRRLESLEQSHLFRGIIWPVLAMISHQLGDEPQARLWLRKSDAWMDWYRPGTSADVARTLRPETIERRVEAAVFHREAKALIDGDRTDSPPANDP